MAAYDVFVTVGQWLPNRSTRTTSGARKSFRWVACNLLQLICYIFMAHPTRVGRRVGALHKKLGHPCSSTTTGKDGFEILDNFFKQ